MSEESTLVIFRRWRDTGTFIALFPEVPSDYQGHFCDAYEHIGQHGGAAYHGVVQATKPATEMETAPLAEELTHIGYILKPIKSTKHVATQQNPCVNPIVPLSSDALPLLFNNST